MVWKSSFRFLAVKAGGGIPTLEETTLGRSALRLSLLEVSRRAVGLLSKLSFVSFIFKPIIESKLNLLIISTKDTFGY